MRALLAAWFGLIVVATVPVSVTAQEPLVGEVFKKVIPSVAVIRARVSQHRSFDHQHAPRGSRPNALSVPGTWRSDLSTDFGDKVFVTASLAYVYDRLREACAVLAEVT